MTDVILLPTGNASDEAHYDKDYGIITACASCANALHGAEDTALDKARTLLADKAAKLGANTVLNVTLTVIPTSDHHGVLFTFIGHAVFVEH